MISWNVDPEVSRIADKLYREFELPDLKEFSEVPLHLKSGHYVLSESRYQIFSESFDNLILLIEESRFLCALAWTYIIDLQEDFDNLSNKQVPISLDGEIGLLLAAHINYEVPPSLLFRDGSIPVSKNRLVGTWFASCLIDSAIIRQFSVIDRLIGILFSILGIEMKKNGEEYFMPPPNESNLNKIKALLSDSDKKEIESLLQTTDFANMKLYRDKFIHRKRVETQLHGTFFFKNQISDTQLFRGLPPDDQVARVIYLHKFVLIPLIELAKRNLNNLRP